MTSVEKARFIVEHRGICAHIMCDSSCENACPCTMLEEECQKTHEDAKKENSESVATCVKFLEEHGDAININPVSKYNRLITGLDGTKTTVDVYRVLVAFGITDPELQHSLKRLLNLGIRGKGDYAQDLDEAILSLQKMKERKEQECK